jgi:F1F0 ATPase subunit 2
MNEATTLLLSLAAGLLLGSLFFGGLWWTIRRGMSSDAPALWFVGSWALRTLLVLFGFHWVMQGDWRNLVACLLGFFVARGSVTRFARPRAAGAP